MNRFKVMLAGALMLWLAGCANGAHRLPYDSWRLGLGTPNYMEVWIETADAVDVQERVFRRAMSGIGSTQRPKDIDSTDPRGWPEQPGAGKGKQVGGADVPRLIYVRWQSLVEPQTYEAYIVIPEATQRAMVKSEMGYCAARGLWRESYRNMLTVGLAPGGIAKVWLMGGCLSAIDVARVQGTVVKLGPYGGTSGGKHRPLSEISKAYIKKYGIPYGSW
jgi:hypothetical protein